MIDKIPNPQFQQEYIKKIWNFKNKKEKLEKKIQIYTT